MLLNNQTAYSWCKFQMVLEYRGPGDEIRQDIGLTCGHSGAITVDDNVYCVHHAALIKGDPEQRRLNSSEARMARRMAK